MESITNNFRSELSTTNALVPDAIAVTAFPGNVVRQSSRPVLPSINIASFPAKTRMLSPPRTGIALTCVFSAAGGLCAERVVQSAIPRVASNATMRPSVVAATISELLGDLRWATIELVTSPIAAYQPPLEVTAVVALFDTAGGVALG